MRFSRYAVLAGCLALGSAWPLAGQSQTVPEVGAPVKPVFQPFAAKYKIVREQTLANGTTITRESTEIQALDSEGRRFNETTTAATGRTSERSMFRVSDPIARTNTNWMVPGRKATVTHTPPSSEAELGRNTCWSNEAPRVAALPAVPAQGGGGAGFSVLTSGETAAPPPMPKTADVVTREDLGTQTILGVIATGTRTTRTTPAGAVGNDAPLVRTTEVWHAKSPALTVREVSDDPQTGRMTKELVELSQSEPDAALFQAPEGYEVVTQEMHEVPCTQ